MFTLDWGALEGRVFETGLDRGALYFNDGSYASWIGLKAIDADDSAGAEIESYYIDGVKYIETVGLGEYEATIKAFTYPPEFDRCNGLGAVRQGVSAYSQPRESFGLSYRTTLGNGIQSLKYGYKIHIIYDAVAIADSLGYETTTDDTNVLDLSWKIKATPRAIPDRYPSAHIVIDTRFIYSGAVQALERVLYGDSGAIPRLPSPDEVDAILTNSAGMRITDNGDGTWTAISDVPDAIDLTGDNFTINWPTAQDNGDGTFSISSY